MRNLLENSSHDIPWPLLFIKISNQSSLTRRDVLLTQKLLEKPVITAHYLSFVFFHLKVEPWTTKIFVPSPWSWKPLTFPNGNHNHTHHPNFLLWTGWEILFSSFLSHWFRILREISSLQWPLAIRPPLLTLSHTSGHTSRDSKKPSHHPLSSGNIKWTCRFWCLTNHSEHLFMPIPVMSTWGLVGEPSFWGREPIASTMSIALLSRLVSLRWISCPSVFSLCRWEVRVRVWWGHPSLTWGASGTS